MPSSQIASGDQQVQPTKVTSLATFIYVLALLLPAVVALGLLYRQAPNVPYLDDYDAILTFADGYAQLPGLEAKLLDIATRQHNEYKLGFEHFIVASELELSHRLNFAFLTSLGNLFLLPIAVLLWQVYQERELEVSSRLLRFLPVSLLFFSLTYYEGLDWAMAGLQNIPVIFFSFLSIYLLCRVTVYRWFGFFSGLGAGVLAAFSSANGLLLFPVGLWILLTRRAYAAAVAWFASFALPIAAYLYHYHPVVHPADRAMYLTRPVFFLAFLGCSIPFRWPAVLLGAAILMVIVWALRTRYDRINPAAFYFSIWTLATAALVAWVRGAGGFWVASRYSIYSILLLIFCYAFLAHFVGGSWPPRKQRGYYLTSALLALVFCTAADLIANKHLGQRRLMILSGIASYRAQPEINSPMVDPLVEKLAPAEKSLERITLTEAIRKHIYTLPSERETR